MQPEITRANDKAVEAALIDGLEAFNDGHAEASDFRPFQAVIRDKDGKIMGGLSGHILFRWFTIKYLWVDASLRGQDYATRFVRAAEEEARARAALP